jgi:hypothetical protein
MSIRSDVMDAIREFGANGATYMEVHQVIKGRHTEQQIRVALHRLSHGGWLRCALSGGTGRGPGRFYILPQRTVAPPKPKATPPRRDRLPTFPVSSPWSLASGIDVECWPPKFDGGRVYQQLGPWNAD